MKKTLWARPHFVFQILVILIFVLGAALGSRVVSTITEQQPLSNRTCIIIDAGHGGEDGGATSCTGVLESTINLDIALRLDDLMHLLGYQTLMIRTTDKSVYTEGQTIAQRKMSDLKQRVQIANTTDNALLVSIHQNQFSDSRYSGAQVFYADTAGSDALAKSLQSAFVSTLNPGSNRQSKRSSGVYLMEHIQCTGVLIECGFLSNPQEEANLRMTDYQKQICCVIASSVSVFLDQLPLS